MTLDVARGPLPEAVAAPIDGVLVVAERLDGGVARQAFTVRAEPRAPGGGAHALSLLRAMALALAGGLVLNLMPCVLPVLSIKALGLVQHASERPAVLRLHGLAYTAGVLVSFAVVAGALIALRAGGEQLGWGFQLQSPVFVTLLAFVLFAVALSLSGVIVVGTRWSGAGQALAGRAGYAGSFFTGALATVAATPCTAPFMGVAVGFAVTQPWPTALLVFEALGLGLALPFLVVDAGAGVAPSAAHARPVDDARAAAAGVSALRIGGVAGMGREPAGRAARRRRRAGRPRAHRLRRVAPRPRGRRSGAASRLASVLALALVVVAVALGALASPAPPPGLRPRARRRARAGSRSARSVWRSCAPRAAPSSSTSRPRGV